MMVRTDNRAANDVRPVKVQWHYLTKQPASVLWQRGTTKVLAAVSEQTTKKVTLIGSGLTQVQSDWLQQTLTTLLAPALEKTGLLVSVTVLEDGGSLLAEASNAVFGALQLLPEQFLPNRAAAVTAILTGNETLVDASDTEEAVADSTLLVVTDNQEQILAMTLQGATAVNSSQLNELLLVASQGGTRTAEQIQASYQQAVHPIIQKEHSEMPTIVIATKNPGKAQEFHAMFEKEGIQIKTLLDYPELPEINETGQTFEENARLKADQIAAILQLPVLADDSGLMVDALDGRPGIYSARFAGDHNDAGNNAKLLYELTGVPAEKRTAHFHTTLVFAKPDRPDDDLVVEGSVNGRILGIPRGDNGFGYDPLFYVPELDKSMAELSMAEKNAISHRAKAIENLEPLWRDWLAK
ncbi:XTP/dITP diphosphatase [Latilactobacillus sakei]|uniref:XTP/dITP diphosphatase n=1 Tax=Latilactobacillus sakei TaxID=1599 RepID=UPI000DCABEC8|nr:XTP/dITP diphosphatase [Latilactobacillus sakei]AWZ43705.1 XTP/dITP diphosphatase [Latilactobacillus sakei]UNC19725.1 XTP/dITP diphosphatase [Latilactobacillus sakei]